MVAKSSTGGGGNTVVEQQQSRRRRISSSNKPSWLLCNIADLDERIKMLLLTRKKKTKENSPDDSFGARANSYYHERPHLLQLLNDLYNNYLSLADRYCQALAKNQNQNQQHHSRCSSPIPIDENIDQSDDTGGEVIDSSDDAESSLSFQPPPPPAVKPREMIDVDTIIADVVMKTVEYDIILNELNVVENRWGESSRKMELQKNLLDVLESERLILLNDNATLGYRVTALVEENKGLVSESLFLKRKAAELARCVLKTREDHRVCMLSRKIEDLQGQIYSLEKRNKEYYEQLVKQQETKNTGVGSLGGGKCFSFKVGDLSENSRVEEGTRVSKLWDKIKKFDLLLCGGPHVNSSAT